MSTPEARLRALGVVLPEVAPPVAAYVPAIQVGEFVYTSGQLPFREGKLHRTGKVGLGADYITPEDATESAQLCALNALAAVRSVTGTLDAILRVVKATVYVASDPGFTGQPAVANGASLLLGDIFGAEGAHVRSAVGVAALPLDAPVELDLIVQVRIPATT